MALKEISREELVFAVERNNAVREVINNHNHEPMRKYMSKVYTSQVRALFNNPPELTDEVIEIMARKMTLEIGSFTPAEKAQAKSWLRERGLKDMRGKDIK